MFDSSTRVVVLVSSTKKHTSPKYGSTGYVISSGKMQYYMEDTVKVGNGMVAFVVDMLFTRYGLGKNRDTAERREVLCITPVIRKPSEYEKDFTVQDRIERAVSRFLKEDFTSNTWYNIKCNHVKNPDYTTVCMLAPVPNHGEDLMTCDTVEFRGWLGSFLLSYSFKALISRICNYIYISKFPLGATHREMLMMLNEATKSKSYRKDFLDKSVFRTKERRQAVIETVRAVTAIGSLKATDTALKRQVTHNVNQGFYFTSSGNIRKEKQFFEMLMSDLFVEHNFNWKKDLVLNSKLKNRKLIISRIDESRDALKYLAQDITGRIY